jgi:hypothetical protein
MGGAMPSPSVLPVCFEGDENLQSVEERAAALSEHTV